MTYNGNSDSFIDHFYDKLIHICEFDYKNGFFERELKKRRFDMLSFLFEFGETGKIDEEKIKNFK